MQYGEYTSPGLHILTEPLKIESGAHLTAEVGARLTGGVKLRAQPCGNGVWVCDLAEAGITPAPFVSRGFGRKISPSHSELFLDGEPMRISRYPREEFVTITGVGEPASDEWNEPCGRLTGGFSYEDDRPKEWAEGQEIWVHGYWSWDWAPSREKIESWDKERGFLMTAPPYGQYQFRIGQRFCFFNIREEVKEPGDYCIDYRAGKVYFFPEEDFDPETSELLLSNADFPAFLLDGVEDVVLEGFTVEAFRGNGVEIRNCRNVTLDGFTVRNIGNRGIVADNSFGVTVSDCHIHDTGDGGVGFYCGDRATLTPADCTVEDCHIHDVAAWDRCYEPPIRLYGVGLSAQRNRIHDCPHSAVLFGGNEISVTDNEIYRVVLETGDAGAIYGGRDFTYRGNEVSRNFIHHVGSGIGMGTMGIYNDDCLSGTVMKNNVFYKVQRAVFLGGGVDFTVEGNVFVDCYPAVEIDGRGQSDHVMWRNMVKGILHDRFYSIDGNTGVSAADELYLSRYPELARIDEFYRADPAPHIPPSARMIGNVFCSERKIEYTWNTEGGCFTEECNADMERMELRRLLTDYEFDVIMRK